MPTTTVEAEALPARLGELVELAASGTEVIVTEGQVPRARLVPLTQNNARVPGLHAGAIQTTAGFDDVLQDEFWSGAR